MHLFFTYSLLSLLALSTFSACKETAKPAEKKVERPVELDEYGNKILYTADGERELINDDCD